MLLDVLRGLSRQRIITALLLFWRKNMWSARLYPGCVGLFISGVCSICCKACRLSDGPVLVPEFQCKNTRKVHPV